MFHFSPLHLNDHAIVLAIVLALMATRPQAQNETDETSLDGIRHALDALARGSKADRA